MNHNPLVEATLRNLHLEKEMIEKTFKKYPMLNETMGCTAEEFATNVELNAVSLVSRLFEDFGMVNCIETILPPQEVCERVDALMNYSFTYMKAALRMMSYVMGTHSTFDPLGYCTIIYLKTVFDSEEKMIEKILECTMMPAYGEDCKNQLNKIIEKRISDLLRR